MFKLTAAALRLSMALAVLGVAVCALVWLTAPLLPPGPRIIFMTAGAGVRFENWDLAVLDVNHGFVLPLTQTPYDERFPTWSPDGRQIVYHASPNVMAGLYVADADGTHARRLPVSDRDPTADLSMPAFSPDGNLIVFHANFGGDAFSLYLTDAAGEALIPLTDAVYTDARARWSPDGALLVFSSRRSVNARTDVYTLSVTGALTRRLLGPDHPYERRLTDSERDDYYAAWSPDGQEIAFASAMGGSWDIYIMDRRGGNVRNVTNAPGSNDTYPAWLPDGSGLLFVSDRNGSDDLYRIGVDGRNVRRLTFDDHRHERAPQWAP